MVQTGGLGEQFQLDIPAESRKQVVGLRSDGARVRLFERNVLLQGLMERFDIPPFTVEVDDGVAYERGLAAHQILDAGTPVFVGEDLLDQRQREIDAFQVDFPHATRFQRQTIYAQVTPLLLIYSAQGELAVALQRHNEVSF